VAVQVDGVGNSDNCVGGLLDDPVAPGALIGDLDDVQSRGVSGIAGLDVPASSLEQTAMGKTTYWRVGSRQSTVIPVALTIQETTFWLLVVTPGIPRLTFMVSAWDLKSALGMVVGQYGTRDVGSLQLLGSWYDVVVGLATAAPLYVKMEVALLRMTEVQAVAG
jgi:hypothetical protein